MRTASLISWLAASSAVAAYSFPVAALNSTYLDRRSPDDGPKSNAKPEPQQGGGGRGGGGGGGGRGGGQGGGGGGGQRQGGGYGPPGGYGGGGYGPPGGPPGPPQGPPPGANGGGLIPGLPDIPFLGGGGGYDGPPQGKCPPIWFKISKDLMQKFTAGVPGGQCNDLARATIRIAFHDCSAWNTKLGYGGGCDGSLYLAKEYTRRENSGLEAVVPQVGQMAQAYGVGVADFFQFAGAHAVVTCPLGPTVQTFVGRVDRSTPSPEGLLPNPRASADSLVRLFQEKGISPAELAALLGAHSTSRQFAFDPARTGAPLDSTPGVWDVAYYGETLKGTAPFILPSDIVLSKHPAVGPAFKGFVNAQVPWNKAYSLAMTKMSLMGVDRGPLIDCTAALPPPKEKRRQNKL